MHTQRFAMALWAAGALLSPSVVYGDETTTAEAEAVKADKQLRADAWNGRLKEAYEDAQRAYHFSPSARRLWNRGLVAAETGHPLDAMRDIKKCLADSGLKAKYVSAGQDIVEESYSKLGRILVHATEGALVSIDGGRHDVSNDTPIVPEVEILVLPGRHDVTDGLGGAQTVTVAPRQGIVVDFRGSQGPLAAP